MLASRPRLRPLMSEATSPPITALAAMFVPMARIERVFLDEQVGSVESYCQRFERRVGVSIVTFLGLAEEAVHLSGMREEPS